jgi:single-stranded-DNA-specific exonuclease
MSLEASQVLVSGVRGQGFCPPLFADAITVVNQHIVGEKHLKLYLEKQRKRFDAIFFGQTDFLPEQIQAVYQLQANSYNGLQSVQLQLLNASTA